MVHIIGANAASAMWEQLTLVEGIRRKLGVLATRRTSFRMKAGASGGIGRGGTHLEAREIAISL